MAHCRCRWKTTAELWTLQPRTPLHPSHPGKLRTDADFIAPFPLGGEFVGACDFVGCFVGRLVQVFILLLFFKHLNVHGGGESGIRTRVRILS